MLRIILVLALAFIVYLGLTLRGQQLSNSDLPQSRPANNNAHIYDFAGILEDISASTESYLSVIQDDYAIETLIITLPALPQSHTIETLAAEVFSNWQIGSTTDGRGLLILLAAEEQQVKIEISYELEDVFTDIFCGYIEDKQLKAYFLSGQIDIGLVAVMEEIEHRAQIKHQAAYTRDQIDRLDSELLSGGAGAKRRLADYQKEQIETVGDKYPAGSNPAEAWQILIDSWEDKVRDPNLGVYTEVTRLAYRDFTNLPDSRYEEDVRTYRNKPFEVIQNENYAVIFFGKKKGWENAPFLFCRTAAGWQFDIVHQRKFVRMGRSPHWGIERADYPYVDLLSRCPYWMRQDIPREDDDIYRIENDALLAEEIIALEKNPWEQSGRFCHRHATGQAVYHNVVKPEEENCFFEAGQNTQSRQPRTQQISGHCVSGCLLSVCFRN